jgi:hypothetical protein
MGQQRLCSLRAKFEIFYWLFEILPQKKLSSNQNTYFFAAQCRHQCTTEQADQFAHYCTHANMPESKRTAVRFKDINMYYCSREEGDRSKGGVIT